VLPQIGSYPPELLDGGTPCAQTDPELFFPEKGGSAKTPKRMCWGDEAAGISQCPVREACLQYALDNDERFGVWGGYSERERRKIRGQVDATGEPLNDDDLFGVDQEVAA
jgi:hypothetical protein